MADRGVGSNLLLVDRPKENPAYVTDDFAGRFPVEAVLRQGGLECLEL